MQTVFSPRPGELFMYMGASTPASVRFDAGFMPSSILTLDEVVQPHEEKIIVWWLKNSPRAESRCHVPARVKSCVYSDAGTGCSNWVKEDRSGASPANRQPNTLCLGGVGTELGTRIANADEVLQIARSLCTSLEEEMYLLEGLRCRKTWVTSG